MEMVAQLCNCQLKEVEEQSKHYKCLAGIVGQLNWVSCCCSTLPHMQLDACPTHSLAA